MKIIDCFPYFNEKELLELRINLLYDYVDKVIICDGNYTHSGIPKEYTCKNTLNELGINSDKIIVVEVDMPSPEVEKDCWVRERMQRNAATLHIEDNDICFVGDCDEIINPNVIEYYVSVAQQHPNNILRVPLAHLNGRADLRVYDDLGNPIPWNSAFMCLGNQLKTYTLSDIRESYSIERNNISFNDIFITENNIIEEAGWHFSWMGNCEVLKEKSKSSMHVQDHVTGAVAQLGTDKLINFLDQYKPNENSTDPLGRQNHILKKYPIENLPSKIWELPRVNQFLLSNKNIEETKKISIIQIGTNQANDSLYNYIISNNINLSIGIFVEPNSMFNEEIKKCYLKHKNIFIENIAIVTDTSLNEIIMYYHTGDPSYETTSCKLEHIVKHQQHYSEGEIKSFTVSCTTLKKLFEKYNIKKIDWILLDVEGIDAEIINDFDWENYDIKRVEFEYIHLGEYSTHIENKFYSLGYKKVNSLHEFDWAFEK
jgi:beta-1,4-mannosyl-glycoprotein beta-1,4-N-acetylglucosaminyltransferase